MKKFNSNNDNRGKEKKKAFRGRHKRQESVIGDDSELINSLYAPAQIQQQHDMLLAEVVRANAPRAERIRLMRAVCRIFSLDERYADDFFDNFNEEHAKIHIPKSNKKEAEPALLFDYVVKALKLIKDYCGNKEATIKRVECTLIAAWAVFRNRHDMTAVTLNVVQYVMSILPRSVTNILVTCIQAMCKSEGEQSLGDDLLSKVGGDYKPVFKNLLSKPWATHARFIATMLCTVGLVEPINWTVRGFEIFTLEAFDDRKIGMVDILDSTLASIMFFFERGYTCFVSKSLRPLFVTSDKMMELEVRVEQLTIIIKNHVQGSDRREFADISCQIYQLADDIRSAQLSVKPIETVICRRLLRIVLSLENDLIMSQKSETLRIAPYCVKTWGTSGIGKTSFNLITMREILRFNKFSYKDNNIKKIEPEKEYWEHICNDTTGIVIDDMCNTIHTKEKVNPADILIKLVNNQPQSVNRAEIADKGKIWIDSKVVGITTNNRTLSAEHWSVEPMSVVRRCNLHIDLKVKAQFADANGQLDPDKVDGVEPIGYIEDLWDISVFYVKKKFNSKLANMAEDYELHLVHDEIGELKNIGIERYLRYLYIETKKHFDSQRAFIAKQKLDTTTMKCCKCCNMIKDWCVCEVVSDDEDPDWDDIESDDEDDKDVCKPCVKKEQSLVVDFFFSSYFVSLMSLANTGVTGLVVSWLYHYSGATILSRVTNFVQAAVFPAWWEKKVFRILSRKETNIWSRHTILSIDDFIDFNIKLLPRFMSEHRYMTYLYYYWHRQAIYKRTRWFGKLTTIWALVMACCHYFTYGGISKQMICAYTLYVLLQMGLAAYMTYLKVFERLQNVREIGKQKKFNSWRYTDFAGTETFFTVTGFKHNIAVFAILYSTIELIRLGIRMYTNSIEPQDDHGGVLSPGTQEEAERREIKTNIWSHTIQTTNKSSRTVSDFLNTCKKNLLTIRFDRVVTKDGPKEVSSFCDAVMLTGKVVMMPYHMVHERNGTDWVAPYITAKVTFIRSTTLNSGWVEELTISKGIRVPGYDLVIFNVHGGGPFADIIQHVTVKPEYKGLVRVLKRTTEGEIEDRPGRVQQQAMMNYVRNDITMNWHGVHVATATDWKHGDCMSLIISDDADPKIIGFHLIGTNDASVGIAASITTAQLRGVVFSTPETFVLHSAEAIEPEVYGVDLNLQPTIHHKSPVNFVEHRNFTVLGSVNGGRTPKTKVRDSIAVPFLETVLGPQVYGPPKYKGPQGNQSWYSWWLNLDGTSRVTSSLPAKDFEMAIEDYESDLFPIIDLHKNKIKPLSEEVVVNGMPHSRFLTPLNRDTSMGFPLGKPKVEYMEVVRYEDDGRKIYAFKDDRIWKRWYEMEDQLANYKLPTSIFKATMKDEPVSLTKEKVRIFQAADIGMQLGVRKYFLPIIRALCLHPLVSECAVGINPFSLEWDALDRHVTQFGRSKIIAGDYRGWDTTLPSTLVYHATLILIHFAERTGNYSNRDIVVMRGLAVMLSNPLINFNGTLIRLHGTTPSGHNLTSVLNSICNSLLLRCSFYAHYLNKPLKFRNYVSNITYGDDFVAGVHDKCDWCLIAYSNYLKENTGITVTMPDKKSKIISYVDFEDVDFLKRNSEYIPDLDCHIGVLNINSVYKSLYTTMASPGDENNVLVAVVHSAMHELFYHGKEVYDWHIALFKAMFLYLDLDPGPIYKTYEERVYEWKQTYTPEGTVLNDGRVDETLTDSFKGMAPDTT